MIRCCSNFQNEANFKFRFEFEKKQESSHGQEWFWQQKERAEFKIVSFTPIWLLVFLLADTWSECLFCDLKDFIFRIIPMICSWLFSSFISSFLNITIEMTHIHLPSIFSIPDKPLSVILPLSSNTVLRCLLVFEHAFHRAIYKEVIIWTLTGVLLYNYLVLPCCCIRLCCSSQFLISL